MGTMARVENRMKVCRTSSMGEPTPSANSREKICMLCVCMSNLKTLHRVYVSGGLAQMVERSLSMREVLGSIPGSSSCFLFTLLFSSTETV